MLKATMTILGLYRYDPSIFDGLHLPEGIEKQTIVDNILLELSGLEILYPNPDVLKFAIDRWSNARLDSWKRIYSALSAEYDPLHNYDRREELSDHRTNAVNTTTSGNNQNSGETHSPVYDDATLVKTEAESSTNNFASTVGTNATDDSTHTAHIYGNIGVTTSTQMLEAEITARKNLDFDSIIIDEFKTRFCIMVY